MKFIVDNQLPPSLSRSLADAGHDSVHVAMVGLDASSDETLWAWAVREDRIVVSKDEDLFFLANRGGDRGRLLWVRIGNCRRERLMTRSRARLPRSSERSSRVSAWSNSRDAGSQEDLGQALWTCTSIVDTPNGRFAPARRSVFHVEYAFLYTGVPRGCRCAGQVARAVHSQGG